MEINVKRILEEYKESEFYLEYKYHSDCILKEVFGERLRKRGIRNINNMGYRDIYNLNVNVMNDFFKLYYDKAIHRDDYMAKKMIQSFYIDPDSASKMEMGNVLCTADGLISLNRLFAYNDLSNTIVEEYKIYREVPVIHFPSERNGINMSRAAIFGDRIDHTLFDLKNYYYNNELCKMKFAYGLPKTYKWLCEMSFEKIIDGNELKGIFVNEKYEVYDLEKSDGTVISEYSEKYPWEWSDEYYINLKKKIMEFKERRKL